MEVRIIKRPDHKTESEIYVSDTEYCSIVAYCLVYSIPINDFLKFCVWYVNQDTTKLENNIQNN